jgi:hypothetical protein
MGHVSSVGRESEVIEKPVPFGRLFLPVGRSHVDPTGARFHGIISFVRGTAAFQKGGNVARPATNSAINHSNLQLHDNNTQKKLCKCCHSHPLHHTTICRRL